MEFTPEQQEHINSLIDRKYSEIHVKAEAKAEAKLKESLATATQKLTEQIAAKDAELTELKKAGDEEREAIQAERKQMKIYAALSKHRTTGKVEEIVSLLDPLIKIENTEVYGVDPNSGLRALDKSGAAISLDSYVKSWLEDRPHLLQAAGTAGAGSGKPPMFLSSEGTIRRSAFEQLLPNERVQRLKSGARIID